MNVSALSNNTPKDSRSSSTVKSLEQLKSQLADQIQKEKASKADPKTKLDKIQRLTEQMAAIDAQIQQAVLADKEQDVQNAQEKAAEQEQEKNEKNGTEGVVVAASLSTMIALQNHMTSYHKLSGVRTRIKGEMATAASEIENSLAGSSTASQMKTIAVDGGALGNVEGHMARTLGEIGEGIKVAVHTGIKQAEHEGETNKDKIEKVLKDQTKDKTERVLKDQATGQQADDKINTNNLDANSSAISVESGSTPENNKQTGNNPGIRTNSVDIVV